MYDYRYGSIIALSTTTLDSSGAVWRETIAQLFIYIIHIFAVTLRMKMHLIKINITLNDFFQWFAWIIAFNYFKIALKKKWKVTKDVSYHLPKKNFSKSTQKICYFFINHSLLCKYASVLNIVFLVCRFYLEGN